MSGPTRTPLFVSLAGRPCLVAGGGTVAARKVRRLLEAGAAVTVVSPELGRELAALVAAGRVRHRERAWAEADGAGAFLVVAATDDRAVNAVVAAAARARGQLCLDASSGGGGDVTLPAVLRRGGLTVAVGTEGLAPGVAVRVRDRLARELGPAVTAYHDLVVSGRTALRALPLPAERRRERLRALAALPLLELLEAGDDQTARALVEAVVAGSEPPIAGPRGPAMGRVALVGAGPGDPGLLTLRALARLRAADCVIADALVPPPILALVPAGTEVVRAGKRGGRTGSAAQAAITAALIDRARAGQTVVRLKGGDPFVFGRGGEEGLALAAAGIPFEVVPGVSAAIAGPAMAGIPVTHRGRSSGVTIVTGHGAGAPGAEPDWTALVALRHTLVILMAMRELPRIVRGLLEAGADPATPAAAIARATWPDQRVVQVPLAALPDAVAASDLGSPGLLLVGSVAALRADLAGGGGREALTASHQELDPGAGA